MKSLVFILTLLGSTAWASQASVIMFYNVENMFDHIDDPLTNDSEFTPAGLNRWTQAMAAKKIQNMASVISVVPSKDAAKPDLIGLAEVENATVLDQLIAHPQLAGQNYSYVHFDAPDQRGIDVALLFKNDSFTVTTSKTLLVDLSDLNGKATRDILYVEGKLHGQDIHVLVAHWPSRSGGESISRKWRMRAAEVTRQQVNEIFLRDSKANIVIMGDFNDNPNDTSMVKGLGVKNTTRDLTFKDLFNPFFAQFRKGVGSNAFQDVWHNFDQIIISANLLAQGQPGEWKFNNSMIFNPTFLFQTTGRFKGYPLRTFNNEGVLGYSDHMPVYIRLLR